MDREEPTITFEFEPLPEIVSALGEALANLLAHDTGTYWSHPAAKAVIADLNRMGYVVIQAPWVATRS